MKFLSNLTFKWKTELSIGEDSPITHVIRNMSRVNTHEIMLVPAPLSNERYMVKRNQHCLQTRKHKGVYFLVRPYTAAQKHYIRRHYMKRELQRKIIHRYYIACVSVAVVGVSRYTTTIYRRTSLDEALSLSSCVLMWRGAPSFRGLLLYSAHLTTQFSIKQGGGLRGPQLLKFLEQWKQAVFLKTQYQG